jgi:hypothetical protein
VGSLIRADIELLCYRCDISPTQIRIFRRDLISTEEKDAPAA